MANLVPILLNNVYSTVQAGSSAIGSSSATGINVATGVGANFGTIGTNQYIPCVIVDASTSPETVKEYVWVTSRSTDALTVVRQAEESSRYPAATTTIQAGYTIAAVSTASAEVLPNRCLPSRHGLLGWSCDPAITSSAPTRPTSGVLQLISVDWPVTASISNVLCSVALAGGTLTSGQSLIGVYNSSGTLLAQTADQSANWTSNGLKTVAITGAPVSIPGSAGDFIWIGILSNGTGPAGMRSTTNQDQGSLNANLSASRTRFGTYSSSLTALPSSITVASIVNTAGEAAWVGLS